VQAAPVVWLPHHLGYGGSLAVQLAALGVIALVLARAHRAAPAAEGPWWSRRWPTHVGGLLIGGLGAAAFLRIAPLGVTAELGSLVRTAADQAGLLPSRLEGLDTLRGCATAVKAAFWSNNGTFVTGLVLGAFAAAGFAGDVKPRRPGAAELGGVLMGWGAMVALGCTVGTLLSGIMAASLSGWVFAAFCAAGLWVGWRVRRRFG